MYIDNKSNRRVGELTNLQKLRKLYLDKLCIDKGGFTKRADISLSQNESKDFVGSTVDSYAGGLGTITKIVTIMLTFGVVVLCLQSLPKRNTIKFDEKHWESTVIVEEWQTVRKESSVKPYEGTIIDTRLESGSDVAPYINSEGEMGMALVPALRTVYIYEVEEWVPVDTITCVGGSDEKPYYGAVSLAENQRIGSSEIKYYATSGDDKLEFSESDWRQLEIGERTKVKVYENLNIAEIIT